MTATADTRLDEIPHDECLELLAAATLGRLGVVEDGRPLIVPVNYGYTPEGIVLRTDGGAKLEAGQQRWVALEVDEIDSVTHLGWSVLVRGHAYDVTETLDDRSDRLRAVPIDTWAPGPMTRRLLVELTIVSGRRLLRIDAEPRS
jgi:nitroimidazol reductase NimA-like FMN-containing flavoprotein (pyridoxamine 5'-phosphate oxidase superfamily)